jgi:hypothetical protein
MKCLSALVLLAAAVTACASTPRLPTLPSPIAGVERVCDMALLVGTLQGDPRDLRLAWLVAPNGSRTEVTWPPGFSARFDPGLRLFSASGVLVATAGEQVRLTGGFGPDAFAVCEINDQPFGLLEGRP